jgi:WD40 repeat protein/tRNA A-37 threonylcarbamoyl transferase component Bud32
MENDADMPGCLTIERLEEIAAAKGDLPDHAAATHLRQCQVCRRAFEDVQANIALFDECRNLNTVLTRRAARPSADLQIDAQPFSDLDSAEKPPDIPGYDRLEEVRRGAQGIVYKAVQRDTKRTVALKILLQGLYATRRQKHRFEREIELVAALDHPHIVSLYDSGKVDGHHYFIMQYIDGLPLNQYVSKHYPHNPEAPLRRFTEPRLRLFAAVARAVAHAHRRSIIHRDLKPANILVDENGDPHVLDFGLAKPVHPAEGGVDTLATLAGEFFGTLAYASPEQVSGHPDAVDTRTDVYALGVILYELLTGHRPCDPDATVTQILARITDTDPEKPSHHEPRLGTELDAIILKALAKDPDRRYQTADAIAEDVDRYLSGKPVLAIPDSFGYVLRRTIARHRFAASLIFALFAAVSAGFVISTSLWRQTALQRDRAELAEDAATQERNRALLAESSANFERDRAVAAEALAETQRDEALRAKARTEQTLYANNIILAANALDKNDTAQLKQVLDDCPPPLRHWEWRRLHWLADRSIVTFTGHTNIVYPVTCSPDGKLVASAGDDKTVRVWELLTGKQIHNLPQGVAFGFAIAFSPDGQSLATHDQRTLRIWDVASGNRIAALEESQKSPPTLLFSPDNRQILTVAWEPRLAEPPEIKIWDIPNQTLTLTIPTGVLGHIRCEFSPDGSRIISHHGDNKVRQWDAFNGALLDVDEPARLNPGKPLANGYIVGGRSAQDHTFTLVNADPARGDLYTRGHTAIIHGTSQTPDGRYFVTGSEDATCKVWDVLDLAEARIWNQMKYNTLFAAFFPDGTRIAAGGGDANVHIFHADRPADPIRTLSEHEDSVSCLDWSPDGKTLVSSSHARDPESNLILWDPDAGSKLRSFVGHTEGVPVVAFTPDGQHVISGSWDATIKIWDVHTGQCLHTFHTPGEIWDLAISPNGRCLAAGGNNTIVYLWDLQTRTLLWERTDHDLAIDALAFAPDSKSFVSGDNLGRLIRWDVATGNPIWKITKNGDKAYHAFFTPDGRRIFTSHRAKIKIRDADNGNLIYSWNSQTDPADAPDDSVFSIDLSPDGNTLLSAGAGHAMRIWPADPAR